MSKWITRKLITWEEFIERYKSYSIDWEEYYCSIEYDGMFWELCDDDIPLFGTEIEVKEIYDKNYTYESEEGYGYHELWFEPENSIKRIEERIENHKNEIKNHEEKIKYHTKQIQQLKIQLDEIGFLTKKDMEI